MTSDDQTLLENVCNALYLADKQAEKERKRRALGGMQVTELLLFRRDKLTVRMHKENSGHREPHVHVKHSDKIDATISIQARTVLAGNIDSRTLQLLAVRMQQYESELLELWNRLNFGSEPVAFEKDYEMDLLG